MNKANEVTLKPESSKGCSNEVPFKPVESLSKVKFKQESLLFLILKSEGVDNFLSDDDVGRDCRCLTTDSLPRGYPRQYVQASAYAELDG